MFHQLWGTPVVLARLFMVYGPEQRDLTKPVPHVIVSLLQGREPQLASGKRPVDWVYVDDVVDGLVRVGLVPALEGQQVDLGIDLDPRGAGQPGASNPSSGQE